MNTTASHLAKIEADDRLPAFLRWPHSASMGRVFNEDGISIIDALNEAHLDYTVGIATLEMVVTVPGPDGSPVQLRDDMAPKVATYRTDREGMVTPLGVVASRYRVCQNVDGLVFAQDLIDEHGCNVVAAAAWGNPEGTYAYVALRHPEPIMVGGTDRHDVYVILSNSHDGSSSITGRIAAVRAATNADVAQPLPGAAQRWTFRHSGDLSAKFAAAERSARQVDRWTQRYEGMTRVMLGHNMTHEQIDLFVDLYMPIPKNAGERSAKNWADRRLTLLKMCREAHAGEGFGARTAMAVFNAACEYIDFHEATRPGDDPDDVRAMRSFIGKTEKQKHAAWAALSRAIA